jgi:hypothetical protein
VFIVIYLREGGKFFPRFKASQLWELRKCEVSFCGKIKKESGHGVMANIRAWGACDSGFESQCPD